MNIEIPSVDVVMADGDYIGEDGLVYCGKCNEAKQTVLKSKWQDGFDRKVRCQCACEEAVYAEREKELAAQESKHRIENLRSAGIQDKRMLNYSFEQDNAPNSPISRFCRTYVANWNENYGSVIGLLFWGDVGTGKTFYAGCIANALIEKGVPVLATDFISILNELQGMQNGRTNYTKELNNYKLLVIDDFGAERQSDYAVEQVFNLINQRYKSNQPLILTTNLTIQELRNPADLKHKRIYDRVLELCMPVKFQGESFRKEFAAEKQRLAKEINT